MDGINISDPAYGKVNEGIYAGNASSGIVITGVKADGLDAGFLVFNSFNVSITNSQAISGHYGFDTYNVDGLTLNDDNVSSNATYGTYLNNVSNLFTDNIDVRNSHVGVSMTSMS